MRLNRLVIYDERIHCPNCRVPIKLDDEIFMDLVNTLTHQKCGHYFSLKDQGLYREIIEKYPEYFPLTE